MRAKLEKLYRNIIKYLIKIKNNVEYDTSNLRNGETVGDIIYEELEFPKRRIKIKKRKPYKDE